MTACWQDSIKWQLIVVRDTDDNDAANTVQRKEHMTLASNALKLPIARPNAGRDAGLTLRGWTLLRDICKFGLLQRMPIGPCPCACAIAG